MIKKKPAAAPVAKKDAKPVLKKVSTPAATVAPKAVARPAATVKNGVRESLRAGLENGTGATDRPVDRQAKQTPAIKLKAEPVVRTRPTATDTLAAKFSVAKAAAAEAPRSNGAASDRSLLDTQDRPRKPKLIRDSFTMPEAEYAALGEVKKACLKAGYEVKKSELLRVGVGLIRKMDIVALKDILAALPPLKAGRPKKS